MRRRPTSRDVAVAAGVSQSTVSIVLAGKWAGRVSPHTAQTVREAAMRLGYRPNLAARNLRLGQTRTVLLVVPTLVNPFFGAVYTGAARVATERGFSIVVYPWSQGTARSPFSAPHEAIDGVLASSMAAEALAELVVAPRNGTVPPVRPGSDADRPASTADVDVADGDTGGVARMGGVDGAAGGRALGVPLVMLDSDPGGTAPTVNVDVAGGMRAVVAHLAELGHRRFWHLAAGVDAWTFRVRARAIAAAVGEVPGAVLARRTAPISVDGARSVALSSLREAADRPTALLCDDDVMAAGAYKAARDAGLDLPGDLSITGFDDIMLADALEPELTTVRLPAEALGGRAMGALLELLGGGCPGGVSLPGELVVRGSTARPSEAWG
jgi:DNA-binding LacI/PurR family transcriptional regulator